MSGRAGTFSPVSVDGSEWSGISRYQTSDSSAYLSLNSGQRGHFATPPVSTSSNGIQAPALNGMGRRPSGNPSPPNSIAGRSSYGTTLSAEGQRRRTVMMEESLALHYSVLKKYLAQPLRDDSGISKPNRARDKLLRLSAVQFQELSTDVYDELQRRQSAERAPINGANQVPLFLPPRDNFHPKRNQARQKLATLPPPRFRDLATDVYYELQRRFPRFAGAEVDRTGSPALSVPGPPSRVGTPNSLRPGSRGGPVRPPPNIGGGFAPRNASLGNRVLSGASIPSAPASGLASAPVPDDIYARPTAKTFHSNTIVPNKSTMVEEDDDLLGPDENEPALNPGLGRRRDTSSSYKTTVASERDRKLITDLESQISDLREKVNGLGGTVRDKDLALRKPHETHQDSEKTRFAAQEEWKDLRSDLETKLRDALDLNKSLSSEIEKIRADQADAQRHLEMQAELLAKQEQEAENDWRNRFDRLEKSYQEQRQELEEQRTATKQVKQEATTLWREMKVLSERSSGSLEHEEHLVRQVHRLDDQVKEWQGRYARTKAQLRTAHASSRSLSLAQPEMPQIGPLTDPDGLIKDVHVTSFQMAVDDLLRTARSDVPESVLPQVKLVILAARNISQDVGSALPVDDEKARQRSTILSRISATASNLIIASKNFARSQGISPVSLLDAAASHLSLAIVELIRIGKIQPSPPSEVDDDDDNSLIAESPAYYGIPFGESDRGEYTPSHFNSPQARLPTSSGSLKNRTTGRHPASRNIEPNGIADDAAPAVGLGLHPGMDEIAQLKTFIDDQTDGLVQSIQSLVSSIRAEDAPAHVHGHVNDITGITSTVVQGTHEVTARISHKPLHERIEPIVCTLADCRDRLVEANQAGDGVSDVATWKELTKRLPPLAFEVARQTKELVQQLERVVEDGGGDDDFR